MNKRTVSFLFSVILLILGYFFYQHPGNFPQSITGATTVQSQGAVVERVIDGDTLVLTNQEHIRLLGINTPEKGMPYAAEAGERLRALTEGKTVQLGKDKTDKDKYGRSLRYIFVNGTFINQIMVREGWAVPFLLESSPLHAQEITAARTKCLEEELRLCKNA